MKKMDNGDRHAGKRAVGEWSGEMVRVKGTEESGLLGNEEWGNWLW